MMGKHQHTTKATDISSGTPAPGSDGSTEEFSLSFSAGSMFRRLTGRPVLAAGVLTTVVLGSVALAGAAGAFADESPAAVTAGLGARPVSDDPSKDARLRQTDNAGKNGNRGQAADAADKAKDKAAQGRPAPSHVGLCQAYRSKVGEQPGKALQSPAFTSLIKAAGGKDSVPAYCARVLAARQDQSKGEGKDGNGQNGQGNDRADEARGDHGSQGNQGKN